MKYLRRLEAVLDTYMPWMLCIPAFWMALWMTLERHGWSQTNLLGYLVFMPVGLGLCFLFAYVIPKRYNWGES